MTHDQKEAGKKLRLMFHCFESTGHAMATVGVAQILAGRGHEIIFVVTEVLVKQIAKFGFRTVPLVLTPKSDNKPLSDNPARDFAKQITEMGLFSDEKSSLQKMHILEGDNQFMQNLTNEMIEFNPQVEELIKQERPDVWIQDTLLQFPCIGRASIPWAYICSGGPLVAIGDPKLPPPFSGYPTDDRSQWSEFEASLKRTQKNDKKYQAQLNSHYEYVDDTLYTRPSDEVSPYLNIYQYPLELEYHEVEGFSMPKHFVGADTFSRYEPEEFQLPAEFLSRQTGSDKLIYFSLGSMGGYNIEKMQRICRILSTLPYKVIVSKGPRGDEYELPANCWGENYLPQPKVIKLVDLAIIHGGNNSFTETFAAGKKMIVLPLFVDQYDNAQRIHETGYGIRIDSKFTDQELVDAVEKLINDDSLSERMDAVRQRVITSGRKDEVCRRVEELAEKQLS